MLFDRQTDPLELRRLRLYGAEQFAAGGLQRFFPGEKHKARLIQRGIQATQACRKAPADQGTVFDRPGDIHGERKNRTLKLPQQLLLLPGPAFPGVQHFPETDLSHQ